MIVQCCRNTFEIGSLLGFASSSIFSSSSLFPTLKCMYLLFWGNVGLNAALPLDCNFSQRFFIEKCLSRTNSTIWRPEPGTFRIKCNIAYSTFGRAVKKAVTFFWPWSCRSVVCVLLDVGYMSALVSVGRCGEMYSADNLLYLTRFQSYAVTNFTKMRSLASLNLYSKLGPFSMTLFLILLSLFLSPLSSFLLKFLSQSALHDNVCIFFTLWYERRSRVESVQLCL